MMEVKAKGPFNSFREILHQIFDMALRTSLQVTAAYFLIGLY